MYWISHVIATIGDDHHRRYNMTIEEMQRSTVAQGRHILLETDPVAESLDGNELQAKLEEANNKIADAAYQAAMKCLGDMVKNGTLQIQLNH